ncbi:MarR family winged helix-turn-helix transcriptional regulator [Aestuariivita sp.]|uniref:MarR family winged helix-turn-helix transcriptional regulator n=1 Tax=Aestuariivita sp. TaxID=1872407 RepID=UPI003BAFD6FE
MPRLPKETSQPAEISDATLRSFSGYVMKRAFNAIQADVNAALAPLELRMLTFSALSVIVDNPGLRQSQLADTLSIERPNLVIVVDELERRDLINRNPAPDDRRAYALQATLRGMRLYKKALVAVQAHEARMTRGLSEEDRQTLIAMLSRIEL